MNVYVLMGEWDYEPGEVIAVYTDLDAIKDVLAKANEILRRGEEDRASAGNALRRNADGSAFVPYTYFRTDQMEEDLAALGIDTFYDSFMLVERELVTS